MTEPKPEYLTIEEIREKFVIPARERRENRRLEPRELDLEDRIINTMRASLERIANGPCVYHNTTFISKTGMTRTRWGDPDFVCRANENEDEICFPCLAKAALDEVKRLENGI